MLHIIFCEDDQPFGPWTLDQNSSKGRRGTLEPHQAGTDDYDSTLTRAAGAIRPGLSSSVRHRLAGARTHVIGRHRRSRDARLRWGRPGRQHRDHVGDDYIIVEEDARCIFHHDGLYPLCWLFGGLLSVLSCSECQLFQLSKVSACILNGTISDEGNPSFCVPNLSLLRRPSRAANHPCRFHLQKRFLQSPDSPWR